MTNFKPMLAKDADLTNLRFPLIVQPKLDGIRASIVDGRLVSRTLKAIPNAEIRAALERPEFEGLDGELIVGDPTADDCYRQTTSFVMAESKTGAPWSFMVFDKWDHGGTVEDRMAAAAAVCNSFTWTDVPIHEVVTHAADNADELERMEAVMLEAGYEGAILRIPGTAYKFGRSGKTGPLLKLKRYSDSEAVVIGVFEEQHNGNVGMTNALGRTERSTAKAGKIGKATLGGLIVRDRYSGVEFRVGTGFTAQERADLWADRDNLAGKIIKYKSFKIGVKDKPRHPVMLGLRYEADLPSLERDRGDEDIQQLSKGDHQCR
jgi:DNA ligase-1